MSDTIRLKGLRVWGKHGANPNERDKVQPFDISLEMAVDLQTAATSDKLSDTINYSTVHKRVIEVIETHSYQLLERLADEIINLLFADSRVISAEVTIAKPELLNGATPSVTLSRRSPNH